MQIVRFLKFKDAKRVLSNYSTFVLQSSNYYRQLGYENYNSMIGDRNENIVRFEEIKRTYELGAATLLSCWTELEEDRVLPSDWKIFSDRANGIAVVSSVDNVKKFLRDLVKDTLGLIEDDSDGVKKEGDRWYFRDEKVQYYDGIRRPPSFDTMDAWFWKLERFKMQREYRFAFLSGSPRAIIQTVIFHVKEPKSYIDKIFIGPGGSDPEKRKLVKGAIAAGVRDRIQDLDAIYKR